MAYNATSLLKPKPLNVGSLSNVKPGAMPTVEPYKPASLNVKPVQMPTVTPFKPASLQQDKVAASTTVAKPTTSVPTAKPVINTPPAGQASAIESTAKNDTLVSQLYGGLKGLSDNLGKFQEENTGKPNIATPAPVKTPYQELVEGGKAALESAANTAADAGKLRKSITDQELMVKGNPNYSNNIRTGLASNIEAARGAELAGLSAEQNADTLRGQASLAAAGAAAPVQVPYNNQFINPLTGEPIGGTGVASGNLNDSVSGIAQKIQNGTMGYDDGLKALSAYGQGGVNALQKALGPDFDVVSSNAKAAARATSIGQTGSVGGQLTKSAASANSALDKLVTDFSALSKLQTGGIPATNSIANWIAEQFGQDKLGAYKTTLEDARAQLAGVLTATGATTPTGADSMARTYLPDDMTPDLLSSKIAAAKALISQKVAAFTENGGSQNNNGGTGGGSIYDF